MTDSDQDDVRPEAAAAEPAPEGESAGPEGVDEDVPDRVAQLEQQVAERTADLQRLQAEYVNYKRRVDRDRELDRAQGVESVLLSLLTVLDDIGRADEHGELEGGFKAVADSLRQVVKSHQLESFGEKGDPFDPNRHEAVFHAGESADVDVTTIDTVMRTGYLVGNRVLRAATVGVVDPAPPAASDEPEAAAPDESGTAE